MTIENELRERPLSVNRTGLYIMVGISLFLTCDNNDKLTKLEQREPEVIVQTKEPEPNHDSYLGSNLQDTFYEINGKRAYTEIDGIPIENYFWQFEKRRP